MLKVFIISFCLLILAIALMAIRLIVKKDKFSSEHIGENKIMRQNKITCATSQDRAAQNNSKKKIEVREL
ncbi:MAG: hypothetical protein IJ834_04395 [Paludibacteraceae bacterium]|nr:hypothetical protein [Paludibacteraceae bacterium]